MPESDDRRRGRLEILRDILALEQFTSNQGIFKAGLNPPQFKRYRRMLVERGFVTFTIESRGSSRAIDHRVTLKGKELLESINRVCFLLGETVRDKLRPYRD